MGSYVALSRGSANGNVIMVGDAKGSRLVEVLESGDMPRGNGPKVAPEELQLLVRWINAGAKFDGPDSAAPIKSFGESPKTPSAAGGKPKLVMAKPNDEVQFARDVGPIFAANCLECHGRQNPRSNFTLNTFDGLLRGGDSGAVVVPGNPSQSLLAKKLRGTAGDRMPLNRPPLEDSEISKVEKWIALGARFDGADAKMPLEETIELAIAERATHEELTRSARSWPPRTGT